MNPNLIEDEMNEEKMELFPPPLREGGLNVCLLEYENDLQ